MPIQAAVEGSNVYCERWNSKTIAPQVYARSALGYLLFNEHLNKGGNGDDLVIGRPGEMKFLSGSDLNEAQKMTLRGSGWYTPLIQGYRTYNTIMTGARSNLPSMQNPTVLSSGQVGQFAAKFPWCGYLTTPLQFWEWDMDLANESMEGYSDVQAGLAMQGILDNGMRTAFQEHLDQLYSRVLYGAPSDGSQLPNDDVPGVFTSLLSTNTYGNINRTNLPTDNPWVGKTIATAKPLDIDALVMDANITQGLSVYGAGVNAILCGGNYYQIFRQQVLQRTKGAGGSVMEGGLPKMGALGVEREVLRVNNAYVMYEPFLDTCYGKDTSGNALYTAAPTKVLMLNLKLFKLIMHPKYNMKITPPQDISNTAIANPRARIGRIDSMLIMSNDQPNAHACYTNLS